MLSEPAVTLPLGLVEELVEGALVRKVGMQGPILHDVGRFVASQPRLQVQQQGRPRRPGQVADPEERGMRPRGAGDVPVLVNRRLQVVKRPQPLPLWRQ